MEKTRLEFLGDGYFLSEKSETVSGRSEVIGDGAGFGSFVLWFIIVGVMNEGSNILACVCVRVCLENVSFFFCFSVFCKDGS